MQQANPLQPLHYGNVLIVGAKSSNFDDEIRTHPRVTIWDSQQQHWTDKNLPSNTKAIFITRFIGHADFKNILSEARKKGITLFNPEGTGMIAKQVRELLDIQRLVPPPIEPVQIASEEKETEPMPEISTNSKSSLSKLYKVIPYIDWDKTNMENARAINKRLPEMGITSTLASLANYVGGERRKQGKALKKSSPAIPRKAHTKVDVSVEILDEMIKSLQDMRDFVIATTEENRNLKAKVDKFRKFFDE